MEEVRHYLKVNLTPESAQLEKAFLEKHRHSVVEEKRDNSADSEARDINWTASKHFTVEAGKRQIGEYIQTWELLPCWLYCLDFLYSTEDENRAFYHYRARFSTPTPQRPIPGTASVYFAVDVSKVKPPTLPVEVLFAVESSRLAHTPGRTGFRERWLTEVIESKATLREAVDF